MERDSLGNRMKSYERVYNPRLLPNSPLFIRVDGKAFHTFTRGAKKPYDDDIIKAMVYAATQTAKVMSGFKLGYVQSDEATFMLTDYDAFETEGWYAYELNKVVSITASAFTAHFNWYWHVRLDHDFTVAMFDARAFTVPEEDAPNAFIWRQRDWERNSVQMLARSIYSQPALHGKKVPELLELTSFAGQEWAALDPQLKYGTFVEANYELTHNKETYDTLKARFGGIRP